MFTWTIYLAFDLTLKGSINIGIYIHGQRLSTQQSESRALCRKFSPQKQHFFEVILPGALFFPARKFGYKQILYTHIYIYISIYIYIWCVSKIAWIYLSSKKPPEVFSVSDFEFVKNHRNRLSGWCVDWSINQQVMVLNWPTNRWADIMGI